MSRFKVGDRVIWNRTSIPSYKGLIGTITHNEVGSYVRIKIDGEVDDELFTATKWDLLEETKIEDTEIIL